MACAASDEIVVDTYDGRAFQYYHYHLTRARAVQRGRPVVAYRTVLGWIRTTYGHVHLAEIDHHVIHNPLDRGHLEPYHDHTKPEATGLYVDDGSLPSPLDGRAIGPGARLSVAVAEPPVRAVPAPWNDCPQVPALVEWRLYHGTKRGPWKVAVDFRKTEPPPRDFWWVYGAGTYENTPTFDNHIYHGMAGRYLIRIHLHPNAPKSGTYRLVVRVGDIRGNRSTARWPLRMVR